MDDFAACADLCEQHGFAGPASVLRAVGEGRGRFFMVRSNLAGEEAIYYGFPPDDVGPPERKVFLDRAAAERHARELTVRAMRVYAPDDVYTRNPSGNLADAAFCRTVGAILGEDYQFPALGERAFPESATDEQLWQISQLFNFDPLFDVAVIGEATNE